MPITLRQLRYFHAVVEQGSFSRAAVRARRRSQDEPPPSPLARAFAADRPRLPRGIRRPTLVRPPGRGGGGRGAGAHERGTRGNLRASPRTAAHLTEQPAPASRPNTRYQVPWPGERSRRCKARRGLPQQAHQHLIGCPFPIRCDADLEPLRPGNSTGPFQLGLNDSVVAMSRH